MADYSKVAFTSQFRYERVVMKGNIAFTLAGGEFFGETKTLTVPHNLGYRPYVKTKYTYNNGVIYEFFAGAASYSIAGNFGQVTNVSVDETNYSITLENHGTNAISGVVYYRIYAEPQL